MYWRRRRQRRPHMTWLSSADRNVIWQAATVCRSDRLVRKTAENRFFFLRRQSGRYGRQVRAFQFEWIALGFFYVRNINWKSSHLLRLFVSFLIAGCLCRDAVRSMYIRLHCCRFAGNVLKVDTGHRHMHKFMLWRACDNIDILRAVERIFNF